jgi:8-amino-7-oxononanoate synthase
MKSSRHDPLDWIDQELNALEANDLLRTLEHHAGGQSGVLRVGGRDLVNFGSNDYLGLASDPRLVAAVTECANRDGWGAGSSPLVTGRTAVHERLELRLAEFEQVESALLFTSGFAANVGTVAALVDRGDAVYSDAKNHASLIDGCRLSRAAVHVYPHRDCQALEQMLRAGTDYRRRLIVTESVFSMDGDLAPLAELVALARQHDCMLLVDEAHATGVFGAQGRGLAEELGIEDQVDVRIGTLSKALGSSGGFVCGSGALIEWLVNRARTYVFSTAPPVPLCAAALAALDIVRDEPWRRATLRSTATQLRDRLRDEAWNISASASQIIPLVVGDADQALRVAAGLREAGVLVPAIRPPSVPRGQSLLRISLSSTHSPEAIERLVTALGCYARQCVTA